ncbi:MAG: hypothetical protein HYX87_03665, partial [Chloroflexi bacterium]|nr:hypothetical protein [Chloroflexota bacterium]
RSRWYRELPKLFGKLQRSLPKGVEWRFVAVLTAIMLIANAFMGVYLAGDLVLPGLTVTAGSSSQISRAFLSGDSLVHWSAATAGGIAQLLLAAVLLSQVSFLIPGVLILVVAFPMAVFYIAPDLLMDYVVELAALAFALIFFGIGACSVDRRIAARLRLNTSNYARLPVPIIRIGVGLTLAILALHNKLLSPNMALTFLDKHYLNFMELLGFASFTNIRFVFAAGVVEVAVGVLLVFGVATRLLGAVVFVLMVTTMAILGQKELFGHLPIMGIALLLVYKGSGGFRLVPWALAGIKPRRDQAQRITQAPNVA